MRTKLFLPLLLATCFVAALAQTKSGAINQLTESESANGWKSLFDGKTLAGWRGFHSDKAPEVWTIEDGCIKRAKVSGDAKPSGGDCA